MTAAVSSEVARFCHRIRAMQPGVSGCVACAPGVIDVMGGLGEWTGSLLLVSTTRMSIFTAVRPREDGAFEIHGSGVDFPDQHSSETRSYEALSRNTTIGSNGNGETGHGIPAIHAPIHRAIWSALRSAIRAGLARREQGLTISYELTHGACDSAALEAAAVAATLTALTYMNGVGDHAAILPCIKEIAADCSDVFYGNRLMLAALMGRAGSYLQMRQNQLFNVEPVELPTGLTFAAIECHPERPIRRDRVLESQIAAAMGELIIAAHDGRTSEGATRGLAHITPQDFTDRYRNVLPSKITGKVFLQKYGPIAEAIGTIDPDCIYKPRSRAEHHIYENQRVHEFAAHLSRTGRTGDEAALTAAGALMYASHWSHSQRCGLGSVETDVLSQLVRRRGPEQGLYGAKLASGWFDGLVTVLMKDTPSAHAALDDVAEEARNKFGGPYRVLRGSDAGAAIHSARPLDDVDVAAN